MKGLHAGLISGYEYKVIDPLVKKKLITVSYVPREALAFKMLLNDRFDFFPLSLDVGKALLQSNFTEKERNMIRHQRLPHKAPFPLYMMLYKKNEKNKLLMQQFNDGLKQLKNSGEYDELWKNSRNGDYLK